MNDQSAPSTQPTDAPASNKLTSLLEKLQQLQQRWQQAGLSTDDARSRNVQYQARQLLQQIPDWDRGDDPTKPTHWQPQLTRLLSTDSLDPVLTCFIIVCLEPSTMSTYYPHNVEDEYRRHHRIYNQIFGAVLPQPLHQAYWELVDIDYAEDRSDTASGDWHAYKQCLLNRQQRPSALIGIATGISQLDEALGGLHGLTFLAGDKGVGKTSLAITMSVAALRSDPKLSVLFYSLDMDKTRIYDRMVCHATGVAYRDLVSKDATDDGRRLIIETSNSLVRECFPRLKVRQRCQHEDNRSFASFLQADILALRQQTGAARVLVVIDSLRKIPVSADLNSNEDRDLIRLHALEIFSRNPNFPFLVIAEIRKSDGPPREPVLDDLRGSSSLGYAADNVLLMWQPGDQRDRNVVPVKLRIAKGRDGVDRRDVTIGFDHAHYQFVETAPAAGRAQTPSQRRSADPLAGRTSGRSAE